MLRVSKLQDLLAIGLSAIVIMLSVSVASASSLMHAFNLGMMQTVSTVSPDDRMQGHLSSPMEQACLAIAIYHEARGEEPVGQLAVAATILNRVRSGAYPDTICRVVLQNAHRKHACQFSFACDELPNGHQSQRAYEYSLDVAAGSSGLAALPNDIAKTGDALRPILKHLGDFTHYHRHDIAPTWSAKLTRLGRIGDHVFYRSERVVKRYASDAVVSRIQLTGVHNTQRQLRTTH